MKTLSLKLPEQLFQKLAHLSEKRRESRSALVREAIETLVSGDSSQNMSCLELAEDLSGCVEGPEDLSFNKTHMRGYGQ